jgi:hypothetical protein
MSEVYHHLVSRRGELRKLLREGHAKVFDFDNSTHLKEDVVLYVRDLSDLNDCDVKFGDIVNFGNYRSSGFYFACLRKRYLFPELALVKAPVDADAELAGIPVELWPVVDKSHYGSEVLRCVDEDLEEITLCTDVTCELFENHATRLPTVADYGDLSAVYSPEPLIRAPPVAEEIGTPVLHHTEAGFYPNNVPLAAVDLEYLHSDSPPKYGDVIADLEIIYDDSESYFVVCRQGELVLRRSKTVPKELQSARELYASMENDGETYGFD